MWEYKNCQVLTKRSFSWKKSPWSTEASVQWIGCDHHEVTLCPLWHFFPHKFEQRDLPGENYEEIPALSSELVITVKRVLPSLKEINRAKNFPILKAEQRKVHTLGMQLMIRENHIWAAVSEYLSMCEKRRKRGWNCCERCPSYKVFPYDKQALPWRHNLMPQVRGIWPSSEQTTFGKTSRMMQNI